MSKMTYGEREDYHLAYYKAQQIILHTKRIRDCGLMDAEEAAKEQAALREIALIEAEWQTNGGKL